MSQPPDLNLEREKERKRVVNEPIAVHSTIPFSCDMEKAAERRSSQLNGWVGLNERESRRILGDNESDAENVDL